MRCGSLQEYESVIELINVAKTFGGSVPALRDVSFSVPTGSVLGLLGHNGAGKTTTVKILSTLLKPTSGQALVAGYDVAREPAKVRQSIGVTGQDAALDPRLTGRENLVLFGRLRGLRRGEARSRADELISQVLARLEVVVQRGTAQFGDFGNGLNGGGMVATDGDHLARGGQDAGPGLSRISACRATPPARCLHWQNIELHHATSSHRKGVLTNSANSMA